MGNAGKNDKGATNANQPAKKTKAQKAVKKVKRVSRTDKERKSILKEFTKARKGGATAADAAKSVKVPYITLRSWVKKFESVAQASKPKKRGRPTKAQKAAPKTRKPRKTVTMKVGKVEITTDANTAAEILKKLQ